ncbi:MAG: thiamine pyrophosphate-dependent dehydrogenase E1 component subunit alpha [Acidobacteria bacterium]|nr:thiamine pyrophosphate-dependent dehydrogenase E1 component subunit alpha [Acidobacteriota bacterium]
MKRYPAYDPPEYVNWKTDQSVMKAYRDNLITDPERRNIIEKLDVNTLLSLYEGMLRNRLHDIALKRWVKLGVISKAWLGTGEEAATIGSVHALDRSIYKDGNRTDFTAPMIRNAGACHEMGMSLEAMFRGYLATEDSPTQGRDLHIGSLTDGVMAPISHVGDIVAVCGGVALNFKLRKQPRVVLTWIGDGSTKAGVFHEAINFAGVQHLPLVVIIQNNQVALGTRLEQHHLGDFKDWPDCYGIAGGAFDGNNVLDAYAATKLAVEKARSGRGPVLLIAETFRMGGHATHDELEARNTFSKELFDYWGKRDPIGCYETYLIECGRNLAQDKVSYSKKKLKEINQNVLESIEEKVILEVDQAADQALVSKKTRQPRPESTLIGVYA